MKHPKIYLSGLAFILGLGFALASRSSNSAIVGYRKINDGHPILLKCQPLKKCSNLGDVRCTYSGLETYELFKLNEYGTACDIPIYDSLFE